MQPEPARRRRSALQLGVSMSLMLSKTYTAHKAVIRWMVGFMLGLQVAAIAFGPIPHHPRSFRLGTHFVAFYGASS